MVRLGLVVAPLSRSATSAIPAAVGRAPPGSELVQTDAAHERVSDLTEPLDDKLEHAGGETDPAHTESGELRDR